MPAKAESKSGPATRSTNADKHPGEVHNATKRKRWTKLEIEHNKALKEAAQAEKKRQREERIQCIAALEEELAVEDTNAEQV
jgi:hypothetical protein